MSAPLVWRHFLCAKCGFTTIGEYTTQWETVFPHCRNCTEQFERVDALDWDVEWDHEERLMRPPADAPFLSSRYGRGTEILELLSREDGKESYSFAKHGQQHIWFMCRARRCQIPWIYQGQWDTQFPLCRDCPSGRGRVDATDAHVHYERGAQLHSNRVIHPGFRLQFRSLRYGPGTEVLPQASVVVYRRTRRRSQSPRRGSVLYRERDPLPIANASASNADRVHSSAHERIVPLLRIGNMGSHPSPNLSLAPPTYFPHTNTIVGDSLHPQSTTSGGQVPPSRLPRARAHHDRNRFAVNTISVGPRALTGGHRRRSSQFPMRTNERLQSAKDGTAFCLHCHRSWHMSNECTTESAKILKASNVLDDAIFVTLRIPETRPVYLADLLTSIVACWKPAHREYGQFVIGRDSHFTRVLDQLLEYNQVYSAAIVEMWRKFMGSICNTVAMCWAGLSKIPYGVCKDVMSDTLQSINTDQGWKALLHECITTSTGHVAVLPHTVDKAELDVRKVQKKYEASTASWSMQLQEYISSDPAIASMQDCDRQWLIKAFVSLIICQPCFGLEGRFLPTWEYPVIHECCPLFAMEGTQMQSIETDGTRHVDSEATIDHETEPAVIEGSADWPLPSHGEAQQEIQQGDERIVTADIDIDVDVDLDKWEKVTVGSTSAWVSMCPPSSGVSSRQDTPVTEDEST